ncbi:hypothetical protein S7711_03651 [Stachybotrys chartarum IBT 7711]|uniref:Uncharacterized protein n=1 Tax=Stachybotrys chartarum (strain CBS 109288 / IBT 7711) TaxID=1280523 RepID=A0A084AH13_STACB|nr:hypothetical protein S7711_03651 [Stachybotrys chartarum IBT 7711]KFA55335.1 hypothetical protein S40293_08933 [Stachybotrys chartarum IBT 40293]
MASIPNGANGHGTHEIVQTLSEITPESFANDGERIQILTAVYALVARLETPWDFVLRLCMGQPALGASLKVAKDLGIFDKWHELGDLELTSAKLAEIASCEPKLLYRLLRHLATNHVLQETSKGVFKPTSLSISFTKPVFGEWINHLYDATLPCYFRLPEYLAKVGYKTPLDPKDGVFQYVKDWHGDMFHYYDAHPVEGNSFNQVMGGVMANQAGWLDIFPHNSLLNDDTNLPLLVDVGGSIGHDIEKFRTAHPETVSRLYLEDRSDVVKESASPVNKVSHDFFTPQPIKGARAYYMHGVLHDWSDEPARKILEMQKDAMTPGYSKLLIHDHIAPDGLAHPHTTAYDLTMMVMVAGGERDESQWRELLKSAGYKIDKIWSSPLAVQKIIEAQLE